ncbi:hypothetical protein E2C01_046440 [Portunus trituberculatus]|uniref:Uncharacterized protein n=1 Tax=Portunus trituberculatus TaxID=210409 RepID=A0A5B7G4S2_PORTR|nr:hypothetical protein [Portunus trituberculatus]
MRSMWSAWQRVSFQGRQGERRPHSAPSPASTSTSPSSCWWASSQHSTCPPSSSGQG